MGVAFVFPGQGSQSVGMGQELAQQFSEAKVVFDEVDEALGESLSSLIWNGSQEQLTLTQNAQPALMATSIAIFKVLQSKGLNLESSVSFVAGHSLGEYTALCAAGVFSLADTARLLRTRGQAMQEAVPDGLGAMAAIIGLEQDQLEQICTNVSTNTDKCQIANDNGGGQLVISGHKNAVDIAMDQAKAAGAKRALPLPVSAPFHSELMAPAASVMQTALANTTMSKPVVPVIANTSVQPSDDVDEIRSLLVEQVTGRVRWRETIAWLSGNEVKQHFELGAGKVLSGLARRIDKSVSCNPINSADDIDSLIDQLSQTALGQG